MDGVGGDGEEKKDGGILGGGVDDENNNDDDNDDNGGPSPQTHRCRPLADVHGDDSTIGGLLEAHHK